MDPDDVALKRPSSRTEYPKNKKPRGCGGVQGEVAEMVMVLSAMCEMRGGRNPTEIEIEMMNEARAKIVSACEKWAPLDLVDKQSVGSLIEDLGLNNCKVVKENNKLLGFKTPPKMSIKEKMMLSKRKMEDSKGFAAHSANHSSQRLQASFAAIGDNRGTTYSVRTSQSDKPSQVPVSSGILPSASLLGHVSALPGTVPHQSPVHEVKVPGGMTSNHPGRNTASFAVPTIDKLHFGSDGGSRAGQASAPVERPPVNAPTWSVHPQQASSVRSGPEHKVTHQTTVKVEPATPRIVPQATRDQTPRAFITQATPGNIMSTQPQPLQATNFVQIPPPLNNHPEISKIVHKLLQPLFPEHPIWTPPSRDYMSKAVPCQMCQLAINEVEGVLLCDACEKGYHMKCLQSFNQKGFPRGEWHCPKCLKLSNGKPLPPKYGRVMRNMTAPRIPVKEAGAQQFSEKKLGTIDPRVSQQKITANGGSNLQNPQTGTADSKSLVSAAGSKTIPNTREVQEKNPSSDLKDMDAKPFHGNSLNNSIKSLEEAPDASVDPASRTSSQHAHISEPSSLEERSKSETKSNTPAKLPDMVTNTTGHVPSIPKECNTKKPAHSAEVQSDEHHETNSIIESAGVAETSKDRLSVDTERDGGQDVAQKSSIEVFGTSSVPADGSWYSTDSLHSVEWKGDVLRVVNEKTYYQSCCINGVTYKIQDNALFRSSNGKLIPAKLQDMWEDMESGKKWLVVKRCYFPEDLPETVGRPCTPEGNEVYDSNQDSILDAGLIQGPCHVLRPDKSKDKSEGTDSEKGVNDEQQPAFLCNWVFDEYKGLFLPASS